MRCNNCGANLPDDTVFCTQCGHRLTEGAAQPGAAQGQPSVQRTAAAGGAINSAPGVGANGARTGYPGNAGIPGGTAGAFAPGNDRTANSVATPQRKGHRGAVLALCALALLVAVGVFVAVWFFTRPFVVKYNAHEQVAVVRSVRIVPSDLDGSPLQHYFVRISHAEEDDGGPIDLESNAVYEVTGTGGFSVAEIISDLPDGTYQFEIEDDAGGTHELPPLKVGDEGQSGVVKVEPADDGSDQNANRANELFYQKIQDLTDQRGNPGIAVQAQTGTWRAWIEGFYAQIVDFGDNQDRLVVAYLNQASSEIMFYGPAYVVEVWEYDEASDALARVLTTTSNGAAEGMGGPAVGGQDIEFVKDSTGSLLLRLSTSTDSIGSVSYEYYGCADDGSFGLVKQLEYHCEPSLDGSSSDEESWTIDGDSVDKATYEDEFDALQVESCVVLENEGATGDEARSDKYGMHPLDSSIDENRISSVNEALDNTNATIDRLRSLAEKNEDAGQEDGAAPKVEAEEVTERVTVPTFYTNMSSSDGTETYLWGYLRFSSDDAGAAVDAINERLKDAYDTVKDESTSLTDLTDMNGECISYRSTLTYTGENDGIVGLQIQTTRTNWGPHGWMEVEGLAFDTASGEEVDPWDVVGMTKDELDAQAVEAVVTYATAHPSDGGFGNTSAVDIRADAQELINDDPQYIVTDEGIAYFMPEYAMGYTFADGAKELVVVPFDEDANPVGTDLSATYFKRIDE